MMTPIYISSNPESLTRALAHCDRTATVEAEYGDIVVEGSVATLAHHGSRAGNPCPCVYPNQRERLDAIGISHVDLDTLGGVLALLGAKPGPDSFWEAAAEIDVRGVHKIGHGIEGSAEDLLSLHAWWAWSEQHRLFPPRDGSTEVVTAWFADALEILRAIFQCADVVMDAGAAFAGRTRQLIELSFVREYERQVVLRSSERFANHLYELPSGRLMAGCVTHNPKTGTVTVSLADPVTGVSCREIVQELWGPGAGGRDGIAGSPRDKEMDLADAVDAARALAEAIQGGA